MATVKIFLRKKQNTDGTYPLAIRITKDRKSSYFILGQSIRLSQWDAKNRLVRKSHPNSERLNNFLIQKLAEANDKLLELQTQRNIISSKSVKNSLKQKAASSFFEQASNYIENLRKAGKYNRISAENPRVERFKEFLKGEDILFQDISVTMLKKFQAYLKGSRSIGNRTVINHLVVIRSIFSQAIKDGIVDAKYYPFGKDKIRIKFPDSIKIGLTIEEVRQIEDIELKQGSYVNHARNLWLLSFYFAGMRVSDLLRLQWDDFQDDRLYYAMGKNQKAGSFKVSEKALKILAQYEYRKAANKTFVFPELDSLINLDDLYTSQRKISYAVKSINESLAKVAETSEVKKKLTMHIARHTFGNISGDKIPIQMLQKLYRHSSIVTTIGYQSNFIHKDADDALDAVVNF